MAHPTAAEYQLRKQTADAFRDQGYEVSIDEELDFLPGFKADLLARKGNQVRVIEVKTRSALANVSELDELARATKERPGWSFELLLVGEAEQLEPPPGAGSFDSERIHQLLDEAETMLATGHAESAFLLAWSACEAALRLLVGDQEGSTKRITGARQSLEQAVFLGIISEDERRRMTKLWQLRNACVHGYSAPELNDRSVSELIEISRNLAAATF